MKLTVIGDVHGKVHEYKKIIDKCKFSICVGDFGFEPEWGWHIKSVEGNHRINPGNHDFGPYMKETLPSTGDFGWWPDYKLMTIRGAESIDKHLRIEGLDWFVNEELNYQEQLEAFDWYCKVKPEIVISHDCPQSVLEKIFKMGWTYGKSQTRTMLEMMFQEHQPALWLFGHHHESRNAMINGTNFICLAELETFEIEI